MPTFHLYTIITVSIINLLSSFYPLAAHIISSLLCCFFADARTLGWRLLLWPSPGRPYPNATLAVMVMVMGWKVSTSENWLAWPWLRMVGAGSVRLGCICWDDNDIRLWRQLELPLQCIKFSKIVSREALTILGVVSSWYCQVWVLIAQLLPRVLESSPRNLLKTVPWIAWKQFTQYRHGRAEDSIMYRPM